MNWINKKYNDFLGVRKDTRKAPLGSFEVLQNLDLREKSGDLVLRNGYDIKYNAISSTVLTSKKLSSVEYLEAKSFWVDDNGGQEITVQITKQRVTAQTTLTPNYFDMIGVWIRPFWDGSSWVDEWHWLNEVILTKIVSNSSGEIELYLQADSSDDDLFKNWSIIQYSGSDYAVPNEISAIFSSRDSSTQFIKIYDSNNAWVADDKVMLMRNYFPPNILNAMHTDIEANDIVFHKVLDDLRIGFGGAEDRLGMGIGYRKKYFYANDPDGADPVSYDAVFLDPYNIISDFDDTFVNTVTTPASGGSGFPAQKTYYRIVGILDGFQRFEIESSDITPVLNDNINFQIACLQGVFNKRLTGIEIYLTNDSTLPYYRVVSKTLAGDSESATYGYTSDGELYFSTEVTYAEFQAASDELPDILGYSLPVDDYIRSWDYGVNIEGKVYLQNVYADIAYKNKVFYSEISGASVNMPDVLANSYHDIEDFEGDNGIVIENAPSGDMGVWSDNKFQLLNPITGIPLGLGTIYKGAISKNSVVNLGQELAWCSEHDIIHNRGYRITDISEGSIRGDYRDIASKEDIIAVREEKDNCYRFFDGVSTEYMFTSRGWQTQVPYIKPTSYIRRKNGDIWYMKSGAIYYPTGYTDRVDESSYSNIPFIAKSMPINIGLLDESIKYTDRLYLNAIIVECSETPIGTELKVYLDGTLYNSKVFSQKTDIIYRIPQGASCKEFQFEFSGDGSAAFTIKSITVNWKPIRIGAIHGRSY